MFILNSIQHPLYKRIDEFFLEDIRLLYMVFPERMVCISKTYRMLECCNKSKSYFSRFKLMYNAILKVANQYDTRNTIFLLFCLDVGRQMDTSILYAI